jgi:putative transposase
LIKSQFSKSAKSLFHRPEWMNYSKQKHRETTIWQRRFWEHQIRNQQDYNYHFDYIHYNPVKHGKVKYVKHWPHSTFHNYVRQGFYSDNWGCEMFDIVKGGFGE